MIFDDSDDFAVISDNFQTICNFIGRIRHDILFEFNRLQSLKYDELGFPSYILYVSVQITNIGFVSKKAFAEWNLKGDCFVYTVQ